MMRLEMQFSKYETHKGVIVEAARFDGAFELLAQGHVTLRQTFGAGDFKDYEIRGYLGNSGDLSVVVNDGTMWLYRVSDGSEYLDWSPSVLGYKAVT